MIEEYYRKKKIITVLHTERGNGFFIEYEQFVTLIKSNLIIVIFEVSGIFDRLIKTGLH